MRNIFFVLPAALVGIMMASAAIADPIQTILGKFQPASTTASAYTGVLEITPTEVRGTLGQVYQTVGFGHVQGMVKSAEDGPTFGDMLGVDPETSVTLRRIKSGIVCPSVPNGGLCDDEPAPYLAYVMVGDGLRLAAFKGELPAGPSGRRADFCRTYNYIR